MTAAITASGNPINQVQCNPHQVPVPCTSPTPQVVTVAVATPIIAATASIDIVLNSNLTDGDTDSPLSSDAF